MTIKELTALPKVELHCHLDGSLSRGFIEKRLGRKVSQSELSVSEDCRSLNEYLEKFDLPGKCIMDETGLKEAYMFNINVFDAREIKEKFASSHKRFIALNDVYEVKNTAGEVIKLNQIEVTEIVMDRLAELLRLAQKQILLLTKQNISYIVITGGLTEIRAFKNLVYEILGKDVIIYTEDTLGARNNKYTTSIGMIKYFIDKMEVRGKEYSMIDEQDEELLINPNNKNSKGKASITKIFGNFIGTKED